MKAIKRRNKIENIMFKMSFIFLSILILTKLAYANILFSDNFERSSLGSDWTASNSNRCGINNMTSNSTYRSLHTNAYVTVTTKVIDLSGKSNVRITMWIRRGDDSFSENPDSGEDLVIEYKNSSGSWVQIAKYYGSETPGRIYNLQYDLGSSAMHSGFQLRIKQTSGYYTGTYDYWHIDDVKIEELNLEPLTFPFCDDFERSTLDVNWSIEGIADIGTHTSESGSKSLYISGEGSATTYTFDLSGKTQGSLSMWIRRGDDSFSENPDWGEDLVIEYLNSSDDWIEITRYSGSGTQGEIFNLKYNFTSDAFHANFRLRIRELNGSPDWDYWHIDNVCLKDEVFQIPAPYTNAWRDFSLRNPEDTRNIKGDVSVIGNTVQCVTTSRYSFGGTCTDSLAYNNNNYFTKYLDIDSDSNTYNSSEANLSIPTTAEIVWAGLYWQGKIYKRVDSRIKWKFNEDPPYTLESLTTNHYDTSIVKFKVPGSTDYVTVYSQKADCNENSWGSTLFSNFAEVTNLIPTTDFNGVYSVADIKTTYGLEYNLGNYGAWALVVIYKNELDLNEKLRNISVYDGYKVVSSGSNSVNIYIDGFLTPTNGDVNSILSVFAAEGENIYSGDDITVEGKTPPGAVSGNAFDSSISGFDANPSYRNANGIDIDIYDLNSDPSNQIIANEQSSATINLDSGGDAYFPSLVVFTTELYQPRVCYAQTLLDKDGNPFTESQQ